jgi:arginase family enzyme
MRLRILDLDSSLPSQPPFVERLAGGRAERIDLTRSATSLRIMARRRAMDAFCERLADEGYASGGGPEITFYGSGDFHHLTAGLLRLVGEEVTVIHFDNHPDWVSFPPTFNCGAWVNRVLQLPHVRKVITLGPCSNDLAFPELKTANLAALRKGLLEIRPWRHAPSRVWRDYARGPAHRSQGGYIEWANLADGDWRVALREVISGVPTQAVWLTIDKDVLAEEEAATNWDQGAMSVDHLIEAIKLFALHRRVLGVDVCGDYSPPRFRDPFRAALAHFDHPAKPAPTPETLGRNATTNARLLACFEEVFA